MVIGGVATLVLFLAVVIVLALTGGAKAVSDNAAVIGALVALGGVFTAQMVSIALDDRRTQEARNIERQRAQDDASQAYLDQMTNLLLDKERPLGPSQEGAAQEGAEVRTLARARTLTVLSRLDITHTRPSSSFSWGMVSLATRFLMASTVMPMTSAAS
jgi:Skp family chaperone for outer membrane proteins